MSVTVSLVMIIFMIVFFIFFAFLFVSALILFERDKDAGDFVLATFYCMMVLLSLYGLFTELFGR